MVSILDRRLSPVVLAVAVLLSVLALVAIRWTGSTGVSAISDRSAVLRQLDSLSLRTARLIDSMAKATEEHVAGQVSASAASARARKAANDMRAILEEIRSVSYVAAGDSCEAARLYRALATEAHIEAAEELARTLARPQGSVSNALLATDYSAGAAKLASGAQELCAAGS